MSQKKRLPGFQLCPSDSVKGKGTVGWLGGVLPFPEVRIRVNYLKIATE